MVSEIKVKALMTAARYENTWCRNQIESVLKHMGIPFEISLGVFYNQCMQKMIEAAAPVTDYIITIDGDTLFKPSQLQRLLNIAVQEDMDAITGYQIRRGAKTMLGCKLDAAGAIEWNGYPIEVDTAHFGLTVLKSSNFAKLPKPWFVCVPDKNGEWSDDRVDSDVYFWLKWKEVGFKTFIDPDCRLGHMEEMIVMYDENYRPTHFYPKEWIAHNVDTTVADMVEERAGDVARCS